MPNLIDLSVLWPLWPPHRRILHKSMKATHSLANPTRNSPRPHRSKIAEAYGPTYLVIPQVEVVEGLAVYRAVDSGMLCQIKRVAGRTGNLLGIALSVHPAGLVPNHPSPHPPPS